MADRDKNGRFVKKVALVTDTKVIPLGANAVIGQPAPTKFPKRQYTVSDQAGRKQPETFETYLTGSELEVFQNRVKWQYSEKWGIDPGYIRIQPSK
ncbi:hypothetical protein [Dyadobacter bucti]|uniref:hypothetical protein n=1 Tax=Dyadobacter bucti TaxID=2572203 RepID=UPI003F710A77